ncbi:hypothetical protein DL769_004003 [Monosporascus sp. CRB-8-3]|nr:hypothetical protein DL769_004003 [Monosporascus sp. CRB-8-3]
MASSSKKRSVEPAHYVPESEAKKINQSRSGDLSQTANVPVLYTTDMERIMKKLHHGSYRFDPLPQHAPYLRFDRSLPIAPFDVEGTRPWEPLGVPPEFEDEAELWHDAVAAPLWRTLMLLDDEEYLRSENITGLMHFIAHGSAEDKLVCIPEAGRFIARRCYTPMDEESKAAIRASTLDFVWTVAHDTIQVDENKAHGHWVGILHIRSERLLVLFDTAPSEDRARRMLRLYHDGWEQAGLDNPPVRIARARTPIQTKGWTCGAWIAHFFYIIVRDPPQWGTEEEGPQGEMSMINGLATVIRKYLGLHPRAGDKEVPRHYWPDKRPSPISEEFESPSARFSSPYVPCISADQTYPSSSDESRSRQPPPKTRYDFKAEYVPRPPLGDQRAEAMLRKEYTTPYRWVGDTYKSAGRRPEPYFVQGWPGWKKYKESISGDPPEDKAQKDRERAKQREELAKRRGRSPELRMLEDKPRRRI